MARSRTALALMLSLTLVGQGWASAHPVVVPAHSAASAEMPCHDPQPACPGCCDQGSSCPDMLSCMAGAALVPEALDLAPANHPDLVPRGVVALHASDRPPTAFRPPIVISA